MKNSSGISNLDFAKLLKMTKLTLSIGEQKSIHPQLDEALNAIKVFDELDINNISPLAYPGDLQNVTREDNVTPSFTQDQALANAPASHAGFILVPGVLEEQS